jgi:hypothetical protein
VLRTLWDLRAQAAAAGGDLVLLIGNHELMNMQVSSLCANRIYCGAPTSAFFLPICFLGPLLPCRAEHTTSTAPSWRSRAAPPCGSGGCTRYAATSARRC